MSLHLVEQTKVGCFESDAEFEIKILEENQVLSGENDELKRTNTNLTEENRLLKQENETLQKLCSLLKEKVTEAKKIRAKKIKLRYRIWKIFHKQDY